MKKALWGLLALLMLCMLAACGGGGTASGEATPLAGTNVENIYENILSAQPAGNVIPENVFAGL